MLVIGFLGVYQLSILSGQYERYNTGGDSSQQIYGTLWMGQTFTVGYSGANVDHQITSVKLLLYRLGTPGTITVSIRATGVDGKPTGPDLTSGTMDGNTLTDSYEWREIILTPYNVSTNTKYAIILRGGSGNNRIMVLTEVNHPSYDGGNCMFSGDSGNTWQSSSYDVLFEIYGESTISEPPPEQPETPDNETETPDKPEQPDQTSPSKPIPGFEIFALFVAIILSIFIFRHKK